MKLSADSLRWALRSLNRFGDTDLFPRPIELDVLSADVDTTASVLSETDLSAYTPGGARRFIVPKDDLSYRQATQLDPLDSVLLTAIIWELGKSIEVRRRPAVEHSVFSYRFQPSPDGELYSGPNAWNEFWRYCKEASKQTPVVLVADIADFYNQISHHTVENQLIAAKWPNQVIKTVLSLLGSTSAEVSRGVPVGPHWVHLLAEASLVPVDNSLFTRGIRFARFVDDIIIFSSSEEHARASIFNLAEVLDKQQRLHLQNAKTRILMAEEFRTLCAQMIEDRPINDLEQMMVDIIRKHSQGNPYRTILISELQENEIRAFSVEAVEKVLGDYLGGNPPDFVRLRWFLRRLAQVGHPAGVAFCLRAFDQLLPAISDICHYLISVNEARGDVSWPEVGELLLDALERPLVAANEYFQLSLLALFARVVQLDHLPRLIARYSTAPPVVRREILLAGEVAGASDWLREQKEHFNSMDPWSRRAFLFTTGRFPRDERRFFLNAVSDPDPLEKLLIKYAKIEG
jgi:hypothetical protein